MTPTWHHQEVTCYPGSHPSLALRLTCQPYSWVALTCSQPAPEAAPSTKPTQGSVSRWALTRWTPTLVSLERGPRALAWGLALHSCGPAGCQPPSTGLVIMIKGQCQEKPVCHYLRKLLN